jgi:hypothetical protein
MLAWNAHGWEIYEFSRKAVFIGLQGIVVKVAVLLGLQVCYGFRIKPGMTAWAVAIPFRCRNHPPTHSNVPVTINMFAVRYQRLSKSIIGERVDLRLISEADFTRAK